MAKKSYLYSVIRSFKYQNYIWTMYCIFDIWIWWKTLPIDSVYVGGQFSIRKSELLL